MSLLSEKLKKTDQFPRLMIGDWNFIPTVSCSTVFLGKYWVLQDKKVSI